MSTSRSARVVFLSGALLLGAGCGGGDQAIEVDGAWARTSPMVTTAGAAYFEISSDSDDVLIGASVAPDVAAGVEIHETSMAEMEDDAMEMEDDAMEMEDDAMEMDDMEGVMTMQEVGRIELPAGEAVALEPGGLHIMLLDLADPLESGDTFELTLDFETAEDQVVTVTVGDSAPE